MQRPTSKPELLAIIDIDPGQYLQPLSLGDQVDPPIGESAGETHGQ